MSKQGTGIEWTDVTWNPVTGCDTVSPGCDHCYARTLAKRLQSMGAKRYQTDGDPTTSGPGFGLQMHPELVEQPLSWRKPRMVFVNSMSDLFHKDVTDEFIAWVWAAMATTPRHTFQVLTKRHGRMRSLLSSDRFREDVESFRDRIWNDHYRGTWDTPDFTTWPIPNVWVGVSAENQQWADIRIPALIATPAAVRFVSAEPLLGPIDLGYAESCDHARQACEDIGCWRALDWLIVGGESGPGHRAIDPDWVRSLRDQCVDAAVPFFFKQWGGATPKAGGKVLDGETWQQWPERAA